MPSWVGDVLYLVLFLYFVCLLARLVLDWVQVLARDWRPRGVVLVFAELVYTLTDPPLRAVRRVVPPLRIGGIAIDLAFLIVMIGVGALMQLALLL